MVIHEASKWDEDGNYFEVVCREKNFTQAVETHRVAEYLALAPNSSICPNCFK